MQYWHFRNFKCQVAGYLFIRSTEAELLLSCQHRTAFHDRFSMVMRMESLHSYDGQLLVLYLSILQAAQVKSLKKLGLPFLSCTHLLIHTPCHPFPSKQFQIRASCITLTSHHSLWTVDNTLLTSSSAFHPCIHDPWGKKQTILKAILSQSACRQKTASPSERFAPCPSFLGGNQ